jgi:methionine-rich copper-binding protein CopC
MAHIPNRRTAPMLVLGLLVSMSAAAAEPELSSSTPPDGASLSTVPKQIVLDFAGPVALTAVIVHESDGAAHAIASLPRDRGAHFVVSAPKLEPGSYRIEWRAIADTTHVTSGEFGFEIE